MYVVEISQSSNGDKSLITSEESFQINQKVAVTPMFFQVG